MRAKRVPNNIIIITVTIKRSIKGEICNGRFQSRDKISISRLLASQQVLMLKCFTDLCRDFSVNGKINLNYWTLINQLTNVNELSSTYTPPSVDNRWFHNWPEKTFPRAISPELARPSKCDLVNLPISTIKTREEQFSVSLDNFFLRFLSKCDNILFLMTPSARLSFSLFSAE